jgi:hypothetical protein
VKRKVLLLAALAAVICAPVALELAVRVSGYSAPFWYRPDAQLGWTLRPGTQGWFTKEGRTFVRVNDAGFRDRDHALDKPDDVLRVAVLGDEHSEAMQVELQDTWWSLLGQRLEGCSVAGGKRVEVLNFGITSYGTAQELVMLETAAMRYQPDLVLLQFSAGNDVQNNSFALAHEMERPFYRLDAKGVPRIDESFATSAKFARHAAPSHEIARRIGDRSRAVQWLSMLPEGKSRIGVHKALQGPPPNELWEEAWRITEALILRMNDYSRRNGAKFAIATVPATAESSYGEQRIAALAKKHAIPAVTVSLEKSRYYRTRWNADGQRQAAELIASTLCGSRDRRLRSE